MEVSAGDGIALYKNSLISSWEYVLNFCERVAMNFHPQGQLITKGISRIQVPTPLAVPALLQASVSLGMRGNAGLRWSCPGWRPSQGGLTFWAALAACP